jgi:Phosphoribosylformimino-5-aminoimidazole carboxamide ribonucleotide (ProFAR) isomerase
VIAIPAIDLREGCCVQLVGGSFDDERVRLPDPLAVAKKWMDSGFRRLHVVDLDSAMGTGSNLALVEQLAGMPDLDVQVGGGLRSTEAIVQLLDAGARRVVVGTRALRDGEWLAAIAERWPGQVLVAADARSGRVVTHGWTEPLGTNAVDVVRELSTLPLAGFLITAVDREGQMAGPDASLIEAASSATKLDVVASGGVGSRADLVTLDGCGAAGAVIGMALYSGALDPCATAREFAA